MTDKYIIHGATYCGDGTTSAEATSNGGVGAWNNIGIFEGNAPSTYSGTGVVAAGDTIYIRSKDASGADITVSKSVAQNLGSSAATYSSHIVWVIDGGTVWSGVNGTVTYTKSAAAAIYTVLAYNHVVAENEDKFVFLYPLTTAGGYNVYHVVLYNGRLKNCLIDVSAYTSTTADWLVLGFGGTCNLEFCHIKIGTRNTNTTYPFMFLAGNSRHALTFVGCHFEYTANTNANILFPKNGTYNGYVEVIGGKITGETANQYLTSIENQSYVESLYLEGVQIPTNMRFAYVPNTTDTTAAQWVEAIGIDANGIGGHFESIQGYLSSRSDTNHPVRNATLPSSSGDKWSWRVWGRYSYIFNRPVRCVLMKVFTGADAICNLNLQYLASTSIPVGVNKNNLWVDVSYIDATTGSAMGFSTRTVDGEALDSSTDSGWSSTGWGLVNCNKKQFSVQTPSSVKQDTAITVVFSLALGSTDDTAVYFVDPDFTVTAV